MLSYLLIFPIDIEQAVYDAKIDVECYSNDRDGCAFTFNSAAERAEALTKIRAMLSKICDEAEVDVSADGEAT